MMQLLNDTASDNAASDDVASGPLVFRSTLLTSGAALLQERFSLQERVAFRSTKLHFMLIPFALYLLIQNQ
jgi:hypothetical protein